MTARQDPFPSLAGQGMVSIDVETYDPGLKDEGPGWHKDGFIAGVAVGTEAGHRAYYPLAHEGGGNLDKDKVLRWLRAELADPQRAESLRERDLRSGVPGGRRRRVKGPLYDIQIAEPLIDETRTSYSLEAMAQHYFDEGKVDAALEQLDHRASARRRRPQVQLQELERRHLARAGRDRRALRHRRHRSAAAHFRPAKGGARTARPVVAVRDGDLAHSDAPGHAAARRRR